MLGKVEQILDVPVLEKAERLAGVAKIVSQGGIQRRTVEQTFDILVPQDVEEPAEFSKISSQDRVQLRFGGKIIETPATSLAEKVIEIPVIQTEEKTRKGVNTFVQHVVNAVEVEKSEIIEETVQRTKLVIQEKINQETKRIEIPLWQFMNKVVDIPVVAQRQISEVIDVPVVAQKQISMTLTVQKNIEISQLQVDDKMVVVPVMLVVPVPQVRIVKKTVEDSQLQIVEKTIENPETQISDVVIDACLTCDIKCKVACETCAKDNMFMVTGEITVAGKMDDLSSVGSTQQQHNQQHSTRQAMQEKPGERERDERGKREEEIGGEGKEVTEETENEVEKDVTGWTEVTRNKRKKMVQIFVKVDGMKTVAMEVSPEDKVQKILNTVSKSDRDVYVTSGGRILKGGDKLKSCEVRDGSTVEVTSRMRGGGRHKDKKSKSEKKQTMNPERPEQKRDGESRSDEGPKMMTVDEVMGWLEESEEFRKNIENVSKGSDGEVQQKVQNFVACIQTSWMSKEQIEQLEGGVWQAVEARRKGRDEEQEERRQAQQRQEPSKQGKQVRFGEEQQLGKTEAENAGEPEVMGRTAEVRTGRGGAGLVPGGDESRELNETSRKGKGKGNGGKGEHEGKGGGFGRKGFQQSVRENEEERGRVAPNMGAGGSHPQATSDPGKEEKGKKETRMLSWADCNDEEAKENEEEVKEEKVTGQTEMTDEKPPGLEEVESEPKTQREEQSQVKSEREVQEEEERRAQEAQEEESRAQEAREEERRAREAREEKRVQEAREEEAKAQEEQAREERKAQGEREEIEAQEGHEEAEEMTTQGECVEDKKKTNSVQEEHDVSNRHMTWWRNAWWIRVDSGPHMRTARGRRRIWRAARRAAEQARDNDGVGETQSCAEEAEGETGGRRKWDQGTTGRKESNTLHVVFHLANATTPTTAAATAAMHLQRRKRKQHGAEQAQSLSICLGSSISMGSRQRHVAYLRLRSLSTSTQMGP